MEPPSTPINGKEVRDSEPSLTGAESQLHSKDLALKLQWKMRQEKSAFHSFMTATGKIFRAF